MKRISCEVCESNDLLKQDGVFVCQNCGCKYSAEEIKKQIVEVAGSIQVKGIGDADTLYNTALDWLNLGNENMAIKVLDDMTNKYPGDKRGWQKLARLKPQKHIIDNAIRLGDNGLLDEWGSVAKAACEDIRNGRGEKWILSAGHNKEFVLENDVRYNSFSCVRELLDEGRENAKYFNDCKEQCMKDVTKKYGSKAAKKFTLYWPSAFVVLWCGGGVGIARIIIGNVVVFQHDNGVAYADSCKNVINKSIIQQTFQEAEKLIINKLCPYCGYKYSKLNAMFNERRRCPACKKNVPWFDNDK